MNDIDEKVKRLHKICKDLSETLETHEVTLFNLAALFENPQISGVVIFAGEYFKNIDNHVNWIITEFAPALEGTEVH